MSSLTGNNEACQACELADNLDILREIPHFSGLSLECLKLLAYLSIRETFAAGDIVFETDEDDARAHFIISGSLEIVRQGPEGPVVCKTAGQGSFLGALALLGKLRRLFSARATEETVCLIMEREKFKRAMSQFPDQMPRYLQAVVDAVRSWEIRQCSGGSAGLCTACLEKSGVTLL